MFAGTAALKHAISSFAVPLKQCRRGSKRCDGVHCHPALVKIQKQTFPPSPDLKSDLEVMNCHFHRYDYLEFTDARGAKTRYDTKVGTEKWPKVSTFTILNGAIYPRLGSSYESSVKPVG